MDDFLKAEADRALTVRLCRFLLLTPCITVPLTLILGTPWLDTAVPVIDRTSRDVLLLHLPGLVNAYPAWRVASRGRADRLAICVAGLGLLTYLLPNAVWIITLDSWRRLPPLVPDPAPLLALSAHSAWFSFVIWWLLLTVYRHARDQRPGWRPSNP